MASKRKTKKPARKGYSKALADRILDAIAEGRTLKSICDEEGISTMAVSKWKAKYEWFRLAFARAREVGADAIADECFRIADEIYEGEEIEEEFSGNGTPICRKVKRKDMTDHRKLRIETRLKLLARWFPTKYGPQAKVALTGADGGAIEVKTDGMAGVYEQLAAAVGVTANEGGEGKDDGS